MASQPQMSHDMHPRLMRTSQNTARPDAHQSKHSTANPGAVLGAMHHHCARPIQVPCLIIVCGDVCVLG